MELFGKSRQRERPGGPTGSFGETGASLVAGGGLVVAVRDTRKGVSGRNGVAGRCATRGGIGVDARLDLAGDVFYFAGDRIQRKVRMHQILRNKSAAGEAG